MTAAHEGVSPAEAGVASAPGPWDVGHSPATGGRNLYVRSADGDVYVGVIFEPDRAARIVEVMNEVERPLPPFKRRPVLAGPKLNVTGDEDGDTWTEGVGWALSWGCQLTFGSTEGTGVPYVQVSLSDEDRRRGITQRTATRAQVAEFARLLAEQFGEPSTLVPDPRDAEIEELREELDKVSGGWEARVEGRQKLVQERDQARAEIEQLRTALAEVSSSSVGHVANSRMLRQQRDEAREEWKRADAEVTRLQRELDEARDTIGGVSVEGHRWQARYNQLIGDALHVQQHLQRALGKPVPAGEEFDRGYSRSMVGDLAAQRDRLRAELDLIGEQRPKFQPGQRVRVGLCDGIVVTPKNLTRVQFEGMLHTFDIPTRDVHAIDDIAPAEPRRWVAGDAEPEVGTTVRSADGRTFTRRANGSWHSLHCPKTCRSTGPLWAELLVGAPLVEVVSSDG